MHVLRSNKQVPVTDSNGRVRAVVTVANRFSSRGAQDSLDMQDGRLGFESFTLAHQLSLGASTPFACCKSQLQCLELCFSVLQ